jgi:hypothetical protein
MIAMTYSSASSTAGLYVDGSLYGSVSGTVGSTSEPLSLGQTSAGNQRFNGVIDGVSFFTKALTGADIASLYAAGKCP